jgi:DNA processing protein
MDRDEIAAWLRLCVTPQVGNTTARRLLATFGLPQAVFGAGGAALGALVAPAQVAALRQLPPGFEALLASTLAWLEAGAGERRLLTLADPDYPGDLLQTADPPLVLHAAGAVLARGPVRWPDAIAMVGSRNPTPQGLGHAREFARSFTTAGWTVVSGLALGIDAAAHEGALDAAGTSPVATLAVVGTGLDRVYPRQHRDLAHRIAARGLILSEYPLGTPPLPDNFPRRNRLIAGLSRGTLVVEAALKSGSLITARFAAEQGREVLAIPGSIHSPLSRGCHALIKQGAKLVETAQDVLDELGPRGTPASPAEPAALPPAIPAAELGDCASTGAPPTAEEDTVLRACGWDPVSFDVLSARTGLPTSRLQARLLELELEGRLARLAGGLFQRVSAA